MGFFDFLCRETQQALRAATRAANEALAAQDRLQAENNVLRASLTPAQGISSLDLGVPLLQRLSRSPRAAGELRWQVMTGYGFTLRAQAILSEVGLLVKDLGNVTGGGLAGEPIELEGVQHQAAFHELVHRLWEATGLRDDALVEAYLTDYKRLAQDEGYPEAAAYARLQLHGDGAGFAGVLALGDNDHAFTSLASWCMGAYKDGARRLPLYLWPYFAPHLTGAVLLVPYYEAGGVP